MAFRKPAPITSDHIIDGFFCGKPSLDEWLKDMALYNQEQGYSRTFVIADTDARVVGYHSVCAGMIHRNDVPKQVKGSKAPTELPVAVLARLAVDKNYQKQGLGPALLKNALMSIVSASQLVAFRGVVVHALDDEAQDFYMKYHFVKTERMERRLILSSKDIVASIAQVTS